MKPIVCKNRVLLECDSTSYELRAKTPTVASVPLQANELASYQVNSLLSCELIQAN